MAQVLPLILIPEAVRIIAQVFRLLSMHQVIAQVLLRYLTVYLREVALEHLQFQQT